MSELYSIRVAARPDELTVELDVKVVHPDAMHIPATPGFALMLLHDRARGDAPLAGELDLDTVMDSSWARANARAFVESVELLTTRNEPPVAARDDDEHAYWEDPKRWLEGRLRICATHPAWVAHLPDAWDSAAFDPASDYAACEPAVPVSAGEETVSVELQVDHANSAGFLAAPRGVIAADAGPRCPDTIWLPRYGARAYQPVTLLVGDDITRAKLTPWIGLPLCWRAGDEAQVGLLADVDEHDQAVLVVIRPSSRSTYHVSFDALAWIGRVGFRPSTPRLAPPLQLEAVLEPASTAAELAVLRDHGCWDEVGHAEAREQFEAACKLGNLDVVRAYIALGIDVDSHADISEETPLIRAAEGDQPEVIRLLAAAGVDLQGRDHGGDSAVMTAVNWTNVAALRALLEVGADPDAPDNYDNVPLVKALEEQDDELVDALLDGGARLDAGARSQDSALQWCMRESDHDRLRQLIAHAEGGAGGGREVLDQVTADGATLAHLAVAHDDGEALELVIEAGVKLDRVNRFGWSARAQAAASDASELDARLEQAGAALTPARAVIEYFAAIVAGDEAAVVAALEAGVELDARDAHGNTGLMRALSEDHDELAALLLARGASLDARDGSGDNALSHATTSAQRRWLLTRGVAASFVDDAGELRQPGVEAVLADDDPELLEILLRRETNWMDLADLSACHSSLIWGDFEDRLEARAQTLRTLGRAGADLDACERDSGAPLISGYIRRGHGPCVDALLEIGVNLERADHQLVTPLLQSCAQYDEHELNGRVSAVMLAQGANYCQRNWQGSSAWDEAKSGDSMACLDALEAAFEATWTESLAEHGHPLGQDPETVGAAVFASFRQRSNAESFRHFVRRGQHAIVRGLLAAGFDPNPPPPLGPKQERGKVALIEAISENDETMVELLLAGGADPNLPMSYGFTGLSQAVSEGLRGIVDRLLAAGADPNQANDSGFVPMTTAAAKGYIDLLERLHGAGARVQPRASGYGPLHAAVREGMVEAVQWLLAHGAQIDARAPGRITALHLAIERDQLELAHALLAAGADPKVQTSDEDRTTPLIRAVKKGDAALIEALLKAGAEVFVEDASGQSALDHAAYREELAPLFAAHGVEGVGAGRDFELVVRELPPLLRAIHLGDRDRFFTELAAAPGPDALTNYRGDTALMLAIANGRPELVEALLDAGAAVDVSNDQGDTPWTYAFCCGAEQLRVRLEGLGASISMDAMNQMAGQAMRRDAAREAIEAGEVGGLAEQIDALAFDIDLLAPGVRPLSLAIARGDRAMVALLLARGADASLEDRSGQTLRERAVEAGLGELFE